MFIIHSTLDDVTNEEVHKPLVLLKQILSCIEVETVEENKINI